MGIAKGDVLIVDRSLNPREGDIAIVVEDNELHLKEVTPLAIRSWT
ncbi:S24 family peptidase, partial [Acetomicrobium hydrogeniformans]